MHQKMKHLVFALAMALCANVALAHGGTYPGPSGGGTPGYDGPDGGGTQGPDPGPSDPGGGTTPNTPGGGATPNPGGGPTPTRPGNPRPAAGGRGFGGTTPGGKKGGASNRFLDWDWWWDLNDDAYLNLKRKVRSATTQSTNADVFLGGEVPADEIAAVTTREIRKQILPSLKIGCKDPYYDARAGAAIALGKVADPSDGETLQQLIGMLADKDKIVRESACLALGLLGNKSVVPDLFEITKNTPKGKKLSGTDTGDIQNRSRAFAAVAIGLIGMRETYTENDKVIPELMALVKAKSPTQDLQVGPAIALQLIKSQEGVPAMLEFFKDPEADSYARAHIGVALGKVGAKSAVGELIKALDDKDNRVSHSAAIALGLLLTRDDKDAVAKIYRYAESASDRGTKNFCLIALGLIGEAKSKALLLRNVQKGQYADSTFSALALGIMGQKFEAERADSGAILLKAYIESKDLEKAALAVGLGLLNYEPAKEVLRKDLEGGGAQELKGHLCTALGLLNDRDAIPAIQELVRQKGDTDLRKRASIALGLLKDPNAVDVLQKVINESAASKGILGAATVALGYVGDKKAVPVLAEMVENTKSQYQDVTRAFATVALGFLGDKADIPMLSKIHEHSNYLAQTEALSELLAIL